MRLFLTVLIISLVLTTSCLPGGTCIKIGGAYQDKSGSVEYCFNDIKSIEIGAPVLSGTEQDLLGVSEEQAKELQNILSGEVTIKTTEKQGILTILKKFTQKK
jgi:hypothetical protein